MKTSSKERTIQWIANQYKKGNISFSHRLQRPIGQWNSEMKSSLIHSLLSGFPINSIYIVEQNGVLYTLDGSQRTSTCIDYVNNMFSLNKNTPPITIMSNENGETISVEYKIAGKKFKKLDKEVQDTLLACSLEFCTLSDYTDDEIKEMFRRQNNGKPLNSKLLRVTKESDDFSEIVHSLSNHSFMKKLISKTQYKNGTDRDLIIQTFMLISTNKENDFTSFRSKDIDTFVKEYADDNIDKYDILKEAMNKFDSSFDEITVPVASIPMMLYSGYRIIKDKKSFSRFIDCIIEFLNNYNDNDEYKQYVFPATASKENVRGRLDYWRNMIKNA